MTITAPVSGTLSRWLLPEGQQVAPDDTIAVMEAMKMETRIEATQAGRLTHLIAEGNAVAFGTPLARITA